MILDSSVVVAVLREEPGYEELEQKLRDTDVLAIGAPTLVECAIVLGKSDGEEGLAAVAHFIDDLNVVVIPFGQEEWTVAGEAFLRFGKGRHPAALNYGDCMVYATARLADRPLSFIGNDFAQTDLDAA